MNQDSFCAEDWYFMIDADVDISQFFLVHKRRWHLHHAADDRHICSLVSVPDGFGEVMSSCFEYDGSRKEGVCSLLEYGFTELTEPYRSLIVYTPLKVGWPRLDFTPDTAEIKKLVEAWIAADLPRGESLPADWNRQNYIAKVEGFARSNGLTTIVTSDYGPIDGIWDGAEIAMLSEEVMNTLPEYPKNYLTFHMKDVQ
ncbi:hypothetical protein KY329_00930 [Candidatus Woesearchaeota archaeon]|nr:hypothetical protein [Candidatus Woesearchaeota archaeon]